MICFDAVLFKMIVSNDRYFFTVVLVIEVIADL